MLLDRGGAIDDLQTIAGNFEELAILLAALKEVQCCAQTRLRLEAAQESIGRAEELVRRQLQLIQTSSGTLA